MLHAHKISVWLYNMLFFSQTAYPGCVSLAVYSGLHHGCGCRMHGWVINYLSGSLSGRCTNSPLSRSPDLPLTQKTPSHAWTLRQTPKWPPCFQASPSNLLPQSSQRGLETIPTDHFSAWDSSISCHHSWNKLQTLYHSLIRLTFLWSGPAHLASSGLFS